MSNDSAVLSRTNGTVSSFGWFQEPPSDQYLDRFSPPWVITFDSTFATVFSTVFVSISLVLLMLVLLSYVSSPTLRTSTTGFSLINFVICLTAMQFTLLVSQFLPLGSSVFAVFVHYLILATVFWSCVIAFDVHRVFGDGKVRLRRCTRQWNAACWVYFGVAYGLAALLIAAATLSDRIGLGYFRADYGCVVRSKDTSVCWMHSRTGRFLYFFLPIALAVVFNVAFYLRIVLRIHHGLRPFRNSSWRAQSARSDSSTISVISRCTSQVSLRIKPIEQVQSNEASIYIRLSVPLGFTWIFGLCSTAVPPNYFLLTRIMTYLFLIANTAQGVALFFAFNVHKRIGDFVRNGPKTQSENTF